MRHRYLTFLACALTLLASSCTHEYYCQCDISYSGQPGLPDTVRKEYTIRDTHKKATGLCEENSATSEENGIKTVEHCELY